MSVRDMTPRELFDGLRTQDPSDHLKRPYTTANALLAVRDLKGDDDRMPELEAYALGVMDAEAAATWTVDGNGVTEHYENVLSAIEDGDPAAYDYLPNGPDLSGQFADGLTPMSLAILVFGEDGPDGDGVITYETTQVLADAYEEGVSDTFEPACVAELRKALA